MKRSCLAAAIPWLWLVTVAAVPFNPQDEAWPVQPPSLEDPLIIIVQDPGANPSVEESSPAGDNHAPAPAWATYAFFFSHLANLDRAAAVEAAKGNEAAAADWRDHEQSAAGLASSEAAALKEVAFDCNRALAEKDAEIKAFLVPMRQQQAAGEPTTTAPPPRLYALWDERVQIVDQHVYRLRAILGEERFLALDSYVRATFVPVSVAAKGGAR